MAAQNPSGNPEPIVLNDLSAQQERIRKHIDRAIARVLDHGKYIMGPEVGSFEQKLTEFCGAKYAISCASGTDALVMALMAKGIGPGDAVICPAFTFTATPEAIALLGATAVFVDVHEDTFNIDASRLEDAARTATDNGLRLRALIAVDLFGQPADYAAISKFCAKHDLFLLCDGAQSFGASIGDKNIGQFGDATTTSFFPAKPLGCYGDGGAILTDDAELAGVLKSIRLHGKGDAKYDIVRVGINGRMDTIQAAILIEKLKIFKDEIEKRNAIASRYIDALAGHINTPTLAPDTSSVWAQFTLRFDEAGQRDAIAKALAHQEIATAVYYPKPVHKQQAYKNHLVASSGLDVSTHLCTQVLSLPMHPYLHDDQTDRVISAILKTLP